MLSLALNLVYHGSFLGMCIAQAAFGGIGIAAAAWNGATPKRGLGEPRVYSARSVIWSDFWVLAV